MGIDHGGLDIGMARERFQSGQIDAFHHQLTGKSVAEGMKGG